MAVFIPGGMGYFVYFVVFCEKTFYKPGKRKYNKQDNEERGAATVNRPFIPENPRLSWSRSWRAALIFTGDALCIFLSYFLTLWARFEFRYHDIEPMFIDGFYATILPTMAVTLAVYVIFGLYNSIWHFVGMREVWRLVAANTAMAVIGFAAVKLDLINMPRSYYCIGLIMCFITTTCVHFSVRALAELRQDIVRRMVRERGENIMIIGAGAAGRSLVSEFNSSKFMKGRAVCVIDDNPAKRHQLLCGCPVVGSRKEIPEMARRYNVSRIIFAIPSASVQTRQDILKICATTRCRIQTVPGIYQLVNGEVSITKLKDVDVHDLLGRESVEVDMQQIDNFVSDKVVMVTGGGGSIGSELCRQIARLGPRQLIIIDNYENNAYDIQLELRHKYPDLDLQVLIGSVRSYSRLDSVLHRYKPQIVFHAAAHKHVPLMEDSPNEAIKNNVFGTYNMAKASAAHAVEKFVLISTDKAVNPTNIMGASKRLCEMVVQMMNRRTGTDFAAVRFGNVLGSNGSVIPLFKRQIAEGGPVTVTHPEITRFFMTIPEAVSLVLQAGCYAHGGEIFILDMGQPVRIDDMARNLIRLSGFEPDVDINVVYTGLRPGEKLYEELLMAEEGRRETANKMIHIGKPIEMDDAVFEEQLRQLEAACEGESRHIRELVAKLVPTYHPEKAAVN